MCASSETMPNFVPVWMSLAMRKVLFSRISAAMDGVLIINSNAATRPRSSLRGMSTWLSTALRLPASWMRICSCWLDGKRVDDAVHRAGGAGRVQRGEHEVAGFGGRDGGFHRFQVAHFADEDHVRVLPQHALERLAEGRHVHADLALVDDALLVLVEILDGVFDRDDVQARLSR